MKKSFLLVTTTILMGISSWAQDREAYAVVSLDGKTVQLFYDTNKIENLGIEINSFNYQSATRIVIDESLSEYHPENISNWFQMANDLESISGLKYLNTDKVTGMAYLFGRCSKLTELDLSNFNTSNVTSMSNMFYECSSLTHLDIRHFDTSNVKNMFCMFSFCSSLTDLDLSGWDTNQVTTMEYMFNDCTSLKSLNLRGWGNANVTDMHYMFLNCTSLTDINLKEFRTPSLIRSWYMFAFCSSLESLDLSSFNTPNLTSMWRMFLNCTSLKSVDLSNFDTTEVTTLEGTFHGCTSLESVDLSSFNVQKVLSMKYTFYGCTSMKTIYASDLWKLRPPKSGADDMFKDCFNLVGGMGTTYDSKRTSHTFARFDNPPSYPGYLTKKEAEVIEKQNGVTEYFFDSDPGYGKATSISQVKSDSVKYELSVAGLQTGAHVLYVRSADADGHWSGTVAFPLYVKPQEAFLALEYFFDTQDPGEGKATALPKPRGAIDSVLCHLPTKELSVGSHTLNVRGLKPDGHWSDVVSRPFLVLEHYYTGYIEYFFDKDPGYGKALRVQNAKEGENRLAIDLSGLATGAHMFAIRSLDEEGKWSATIIRPLYVYRKTAGVVALEYYFDNADPEQGKAHQVALPENGSSQFAFEVSLQGLSVGEHVLNVRAKGSNGLWTTSTNQHFTLTDNESGIGSIVSNEDGSALIFTVGGYRTTTQQRGPIIIKSKNGKTRKVIIK